MSPSLLPRFLSARRPRQRRPARSERHPTRKLLLEPLENRELLSVNLPGFAVPHHLQHPAVNAIAPLSTAGPTGYTPAQVRQAYGFNSIAFGTVAGNGAGTTIAIVDAYDDPNIVNDLHQFDVQFGLPDPVFRKVNQTGGSTMPASNKGWATEIALDVEWAHAIAPGASILLVEANSASYTDLLTAVDYARRAPGVVAVSMSWGSGEFSGESSFDSYFTTPTGHSGVTFLASSGDSGAPASYPASSPNVVAVGGTSLYLSQGNYASESGWSGSGGGISAYERQPTYQNGVVTQSTTYRANPDVAYDSDPYTGFPVYDSFNNPTSAPWGQWGGTSAAAPQWAALVAIADQGRALAGKSALDGPTQTLPLLYALPSADFHDVTTGSSTGSPAYSAGVGYDLVTGRGTPYANLVVRDLVGTTPTPAAARFSVAASIGATSTAGQSFSITVSALDSVGNRVTGYRGSVHFASSDGSATLPADYTFTAGDNGTHAFTAVKLVTAGSQTISVTDKSSSSTTGSASVSVLAAAAHHLAFGQQPTSTGASTVISPAVTVRVVDQYNNVLTSDRTDKVTLAIGTNPGGGSLSGTTTVTVNGGTAVFSTLAISKPGNGYTLIASSGKLTKATSAIFVVSTSAATIEGFESGNLQAYTVVGATTPTAAVSTKTKHDGSYALSDTAGNDWIYRNDSAAQVRQGDTLSVWMQFSGSLSGRSYFGFGASSTGTLSLVAAPNSGQFLLQDCSGYGFTNVAAVNQAWQANRWYRLEVSWATSGTVVGKLYDSNGTKLLNTVTGSARTIASGGIAFRAIGTTTYWDTVQVTHAVTPAHAPAAGSVLASATSVLDQRLAIPVELLARYTQTLPSGTTAFSALIPPGTMGLGSTPFGGESARRAADDVFADWPSATRWANARRN